METEKLCTMCDNPATHIATETGDYLCRKCARINQNIKEGDYYDKAEKHPMKEIK